MAAARVIEHDHGLVGGRGPGRRRAAGHNPAGDSTAVAAIPIAVWEFSPGTYLIVKGFRPSPVTAGMVAASTRPVQDAAV
ncbi:hypothetical protein AB0H57_28940 [Micromonospora sp. NPDC050686]|uniref:hypothetical protein n=1 Tax=Micromonospora sp. NPDC050686 TaxID=3154631 RepID=UPI0033CCEA4D